MSISRLVVREGEMAEVAQHYDNHKLHQSIRGRGDVSLHELTPATQTQAEDYALEKLTSP